ncbi:MAG: hypothetical protein EB033_12430, partial [Proteobacteria bacterium]|nr:hypothetical protein [Pseudomonadota bacterium]
MSERIGPRRRDHHTALVERGVLAYDEPLARWWPAFGAHGKGNITVRHA